MQTINLDLSKKGVIPLLYAKQGDVGRKFRAIITDEGNAYPLPGGAAVSVWYSGSSGAGNYTDVGAGSAVSVSGNEIVVEMITQMLAAPGVGAVCIVISTANGDQLGTWNIPYIVEQLPGMGSEAAKEYFTAFSKAVKDLAYPDASLSAAGKAADAAAVGKALGQKLSTSGGTINGHLSLKGQSTQFVLEDADSGGKMVLYKNAGTSGGELKDYGVQLQDFSAVDGLRDSLNLCRNMELSKKLRLLVRKDDDSGDTSYYLYGTHNKPTYSDVGAAPDGYGLGNAKLISADAIDTTTAPGFYCIAGTMTVNNVTANYWYMIVGAYGKGSQHFVQKLYPVSSYRVELVRFSQTGVVNEWGCSNPPMIVGVEYRTTERHNGKTVYAKAIDFGALPNADAKNVLYSSAAATATDVRLVLSDGCVATSGPNFDRNFSNDYQIWLDNSQYNVRVITNGDFSSLTAVAIVKYVKD